MLDYRIYTFSVLIATAKLLPKVLVPNYLMNNTWCTFYMANIDLGTGDAAMKKKETSDLVEFRV